MVGRNHAPIEPTPTGVRLRLRIQPRASSTEVAGLHGEAIRIRLAAPPVDGAANRALVDFLVVALSVPRSQVTLKSGAAGRDKVILIGGLSVAEAAKRLGLD